MDLISNRYLKDGKSGMTIMEIGVFSGFTPDKDSLVEVNEFSCQCQSCYIFSYFFFDLI